MMAALAAGVMAVSLNAADVKTELTTPKQKSSYAIGAHFGRQLKTQPLELDLEVVARGIKDGYGGTVGFSDQELKEIVESLQKDIQAKMSEAGEKAKGEGEKFLAENAKKEGVKAGKDGLQYKVITEGKGLKPKAEDVVSTHYRGTLINGTEFDSSYKRGEPTEFPVNRVIPGWTQALTNMNVGSKWQVFIPSDLAYGPTGMPPTIPPNSVLVFEMELLAIKNPGAAGAPGSPQPK
jgi:FKBP-type peptidyl-prolyl cis-trans isomerase